MLINGGSTFVSKKITQVLSVPKRCQLTLSEMVSDLLSDVC